MNSTLSKQLCFVVLMGLCVSAVPEIKAETLSRDETVKRALVEFQKGAYSQALSLLKQSKAQNDPAVLYWEGQSEYKLQNFAGAAKYLGPAVQLDKTSQFKDAPYLLGQSLYATQDFREAKGAFQKSLDRKYKVGASLYYIGYIENMLNQEEEALKDLSKILQLPPADSEMKQAAAFQIGEIYYERAQKIKDKKKQRFYYTTTVIPAYEKTIAMDATNALATQSHGRIADIGAKVGSEIPHTKSGVPMPAQPWQIRVSQDVKYDSNLVNQSDNKLLKVENAGSPLEKTALFGKYEFVFFNWLALTPELSTDMTLHARRKVGYVFNNDVANINPALRTRLDHKALGRPAAGLVEYEFAWSLKDYNATHDFLYYSRSHNFILGERLEYFKVGSTTLKTNTKFIENQNPSLNAFAPAFNISQNFLTFQRYTLNAGFTFENQRSRDPQYDQRAYRFNFSYSMPALFWQTNVDWSVAYSLTDLVNQRENRGLEKSFSPGVTLTKTLDRESHWSVNLNYTFTNNRSKDRATYAYSKHVVGAGVTATY